MKQRVAVAFQSHQSSEHFSIKKGCLCWKVKESQTPVAQACIELHRPCFRRSEARQRDWSHFRYGKVNPGCYIFPAHSEWRVKTASQRAVLSLMEISWHKHLWYIRFLHFSPCWKQVGPAAPELTVWRKTSRRAVPCGESMENTSSGGVQWQKYIAQENPSVSRHIDQLISNPLVAAPLRHASRWSSYVFRNLTPDSFRPPHIHSGHTVEVAADTEPD